MSDLSVPETTISMKRTALEGPNIEIVCSNPARNTLFNNVTFHPSSPTYSLNIKWANSRVELQHQEEVDQDNSVMYTNLKWSFVYWKNFKQIILTIQVI
jgi:hypothetical protein